MQEVTELNLKSGIRVWVKPLSRHARNGISEAAERLYPYPDKKQYEEALPEDIAIPGMTVPAEENKEYQAAVIQINRLRSEYNSLAMLTLCLSYPDFPQGKPQVIEHFAPYLAELREWSALPEDEWEATLRFGVIQSTLDETQLFQIVREELPVTEAEVSEEMRVFRPALQVAPTKLLDSTRKHPPGAKAESESQSQ